LGPYQETTKSHDIDDSTGQPAMAYEGTAPWHGMAWHGAKSTERIDSAWFGSGAALKALAWKRAEALIEQSAIG
jgi:hypothetical protein